MAALVVARDPHAWDQFVGSAVDGSILQSWAWGELKSRYGWQPRRFFWERDGVIRGAVAVLRRPLPGGLAMDYAPHGPVLNGHLREWPALWGALRRELATSRGTILKVEPQWTESDAWILQETGARAATAIQHRATAHLDLTGGDAVFGRMSASARRNMRLAQRDGVVVERRHDATAVEALHGLLVETADRQGFIVRPPQYYRDLFTEFNRSEAAKADAGTRSCIYLARDGDAVVAASMVVSYGQRLTYLFSGSNDRGRQLRAPYLIQHAAILDAQAAGCSSYDLWGMPIDPQPGTAGWGYAHFKTMLGGAPTRFSGAWDLPVRRPLAAAYHLAERVTRVRAA